MSKQHWRRKLAALLVTLALLVSVGFAFRAQPEKEASETVLSLGGELRFVHQRLPGRSPFGSFPDDFPPPAPDWLRKTLGDHLFQSIDAVRLGKTSGLAKEGVDNDELKQVVTSLIPLRNLRSLSVNGIRVTNGGWRPIAKLTQVQNLEMWFARVGDRHLDFLRQLTEMRQLRIHCTRSKGAFLRYLRDWKSLSQLRLVGENLVASDLVDLQALETVSDLAVRGDRVDGAVFGHMQSMRSLRRLDIASNALNDRALIDIATLPLTHVSIGGGLSDKAFAHLAKIQTLQSLSIRTTSGQFEGNGLTYLHDHPNLRSLAVGTMTPSTDSFKPLLSIPNLERLELRCGVDGKNLNYLKQLHSLKFIETGLTQSQQTELSQALPNCSIYCP